MLAQLEVGDALFRAGLRGLLAGDQREFRLGVLETLLHVGVGIDAGIHDDLLDLRHLIHVAITVLRLQGRDHALFVKLIKFGGHN
jgi:hypothetical protein